MAMDHRPIYGPLRRYITPREAANLQSFPPDFQFGDDEHETYKQLGNAVNVVVIQSIFTLFVNFLNQKLGEQNHVISCLKDDGYSKEQFAIAYEYLFKKIRYPQSDVDLSKLISSLEQLFRVTPEQDKKKLHIGVFGELLFLLFLYDHGYKEIFAKYHSYFYSKHDIEIDGHNRIEIKSTTESHRIHSFKHDQLFRQDINVYVGSLILEYSQEGTSLFSLFEKVMLINF